MNNGVHIKRIRRMECENWKKAKEFGLDYYPQEFEIIGFNEMLAYEAYVGMPSKYPHGVMVNHMKKIKHYIH